ncbi:hypothetical protein HY410_01970, partial [Candidatus Gottesmanbacteria bacterium]|nr:hypothetical protein [Candidatus Gottesmanbacteria bacterium]
STVASFTTPNCLPELIATLNSVPDLNVGQNHTFSGTINNQGPVSAGTSQARFCVALSGVNQDCYNSSATMVGSAHNVGNLASQGQQSLTSATWQPQNAGQYVAWLCADIAKVVSEQIETNNCANRTFSVSTVSVPPVACSPSSQTVNIGQAANLSASGGSGTYSWTASGGSPSSGSGANFSVSYSTSGGKTVRVTSGGVSANCSVSVQSIPQISLTVTTNCPNGIDAIVHLSWTSGTSDSQFNIVRDGVWITSTNIKSWDSGPEAQGQSHTWNVLGVQTGTLSNSVTKTTATCVPPPPTGRTSPCPPKGDLNGDNIVGQKDLDLIGTFYGQTSQYHLDRADLDGNGAINTQDIFLLGQFVGGSINTFPACPTVPPPSPSPSPSPTPPPGGIRLTVTSDCLDGVNAHVHLRWTVSTGDTQFGLVADGITFTSTFDTFWDSSVPEVQGRVRSWTVWGVQTGTVSNTVTHRTITCGSQPSPTPPPGEIRLTVTSDCLDGVNAQVHLRWTATTGDIQFNIVKNGIHLVSTFGTSWDSGGGHGGRNSWNVMGLQTGTLSNTVTHTTATCAPQPQLPDLTVQSISFDKDPFPTYQANETVTVNVVIENIGPVDVTKVNVRFFSDLTSRPDCSTPSASAQTTLAEVDGNRGTASWGPFTFSAPATVGAKQAWALVGCGTTQSRVDNDTRSKTYNVSEVGAWFETTGGDVGSRKQIKVGQTPPAGRFQSSYILVGNPADSSAKTARWKLSTYSRNLVPAGKVYDYFASRFLSKAQQNPCNITSNSSGLRYCSGTQTIGGLNLTGTNAVWFIIGDLVVNADVTVDPGSTAVFLVSGNIFINTNVNRADGVYIAGGTFNDSDSANASGRQLVINGAVYAQNVSLARVLGGPTCSSGPECDNAQTPALLVNFAPKYLMQMTSLLGSPSFLWREIEP